MQELKIFFEYIFTDINFTFFQFLSLCLSLIAF